MGFMNSDLTGGFRSVRVWNEFQAFHWFSLYLVWSFSKRVGCEVMKKLFGSSFLCLSSRDKSSAMNSEELKVLATAGLLKLWHLRMGALLGAILLGFSAPVMGQPVKSTLLG